ncbi:hypothetical protein [Sphingomonas sp.]|jgi:hypothetical protein|uniref:hypothetical protein n=1 Tax=Sphingomonas sp. TaxID=28214 RepID=UPI000DBBDAA2|nr:hypothetical protein [Sphingomonas sp.]PZT94148.1 MAG: hypothetical protein DI625_08410 [Sphingomonas sp.]
MQRIILTLDQARTLQRDPRPWPADWVFLLDIDVPEKPDIIADPLRMSAAMEMKRMGCGDDHIAEQLAWKPGSTPLRQIARIIKKMNAT